MKLLLIFVSIGLCPIAFSQDTCFVTAIYGENPDAGSNSFYVEGGISIV